VFRDALAPAGRLREAATDAGRGVSEAFPSMAFVRTRHLRPTCGTCTESTSAYPSGALSRAWTCRADPPRRGRPLTGCEAGACRPRTRPRTDGQRRRSVSGRRIKPTGSKPPAGMGTCASSAGSCRQPVEPAGVLVRPAQPSARVNRRAPATWVSITRWRNAAIQARGALCSAGHPAAGVIPSAGSERERDKVRVDEPSPALVRIRA
jgi:hypothetical protein